MPVTIPVRRELRGALSWAVVSRSQMIKSLPLFQNGAKSVCEMCFAIGTQHLRCRGHQPKHVSDPDYVIKNFKPNAKWDLFAVQCLGCHLLGVLAAVVTKGALPILFPGQEEV